MRCHAPAPEKPCDLHSPCSYFFSELLSFVREEAALQEEVLYCLLAISAVAVWVVGLAKSVEVGIQRTVSGAELGEGCACFSTTEVAVVLLPDFAPPCRRDGKSSTATHNKCRVREG